MAKKNMLTCVFRNHRDARVAYDRLLVRGYTSDEISLLMSESTRKVYAEDHPDAKEEPGSLATEGMGVGGAIGTAVGATAAAVAMIGTAVMIPGIGLVLGPIVGAFAGGGAGAVAGGLVGGLIGLGITEPNARAYEEVLKNGGVALGVSPHDADDDREIRKDFQELGAEHICTASV